MGLLAYGVTGWGDELFFATLMTIAVALAAIFAKATRELHVKDIINMQRIDIGSGYPSDPKVIENAKAISNNLSKKEIVFIRHASDTGQLYGSVSPKDISNKLAEDKYDIQPSKINLSSAIKNIGIFDIIIKLHAEVSFNITLNVATSDENAKRQKDELLNEKVIIKSPEKLEADKKLGSDSAIEEQESESSQRNKKDKANSKASIKKAKSKRKVEDKSEIKINTSSNKESDEKQGEESEITSTKVEDEKKK